MTTIDLNHITIFLRVVEAGSFTAAAKLVGVPVSSVSRAIAHLEDSLGARLLQRTTRQLSVTEAGQEYYRRMVVVLAEVEDAARTVAGFASDVRGPVRITAPSGFGEQQLPTVIAKVIQRHPGLSIELRLTNRFVDLIADGVDLAIRAGHLPDSSLMARRIADSTLGLVAAPAYLERRGRPRAPADLAQHSCLCYGSREGKIPWRLTGPSGRKTIAVNAAVVSDDMLLLRDVAARGVGIAYVPVEICRGQLESGALVRVLPRWGAPGGGLFLVWPSQRLVPARVVAAREALFEELLQVYA